MNIIVLMVANMIIVTVIVVIATIVVVIVIDCCSEACPACFGLCFAYSLYAYRAWQTLYASGWLRAPMLKHANSTAQSLCAHDSGEWLC